MKMNIVALLGVVGALLGTAPLEAHHAFAAEFDSHKTISVQGTIYKVEMTSPHGWIHVTVKGDDGRAKNYSFQTSAPAVLSRVGIDKKTFAIGSPIILEGWLARNGTNRAFCRIIRTLEGKVLFSFDSEGNPSTATPF